VKGLDRFLTIVVTATLTSAAWILFGSAHTSTWLAEESSEAASVGDERPPTTVTGGAARRGTEAPAIIDSDALAGTLIIPVEGIRSSQLIDTFAEARGEERVHGALDIMAPLGTRILAAAPGNVESLFQSEAGGNTIYVRSSDGQTIYYYAHLDTYSRDLQEGDVVQRGQVLGTVGFSGNASPDAPHLHFAIMRTSPDAEWWEPATAINPYPLLTGGRP
jgi:murein DD-endopeptidase MepM/ murein hydrolase activator NlpD